MNLAEVCLVTVPLVLLFVLGFAVLASKLREKPKDSFFDDWTLL